MLRRPTQNYATHFMYAHVVSYKEYMCEVDIMDELRQNLLKITIFSLRHMI